MNHLLVFLLVIAVFFMLNEACPKSRIVIQNQLGPGIPLQYHCRGKQGNTTRDTGVATLRTFNANYTITIIDRPVNGTRAMITCDLSYGPRNEYYYDVQVFYGAMRCIQRIHLWTAKIDGIYFKKKDSYPMKLVLKWRKR